MTPMSECFESALSHVLNSMCFATLEHRGEGTVPHPICAAISFSGDVEGELRIALDLPLAAQLAADFLAVDMASLQPVQARFFVLELANILCGEMLASVAPSKQYQITVPRDVLTSASDVFPYCFSVRGEAIDIGVDFGISEPAMQPVLASGPQAS